MDHPPNRAREDAAPQRPTPRPEDFGTHASCCGVLPQGAAHASHRRSGTTSCRPRLQFREHGRALPLLPERSPAVVRLPTRRGVALQGLPSHAHTRDAVAPVAPLRHPQRIESDVSHGAVPPRPEPRRSVGHDDHRAGRRGTPPVPRARHPFAHRARTVPRAGARTGRRPRVLCPCSSDSSTMTTFGSRPARREPRRLRFPPAHPTALARDRHARAGALGPGGPPGRAAPPASAGADGQPPRPERAGAATHRVRIPDQTAPGRRRTSRRDRRPAAPAARFGRPVGAARVPDPSGRPLGVEPTPRGAASVAAPSAWRTRPGPPRERPAAPATHAQGTPLVSTGRSGTAAAARTWSTGRAVSGAALAWARRPATSRAACRRVGSSTSRAGGAARGLVDPACQPLGRACAHPASRRVGSTPVADAGTVGPFGRRRWPARGSRSLGVSDSIRTSIAGWLRVAPLGRPPPIRSDPMIIPGSPHFGSRPCRLRCSCNDERDLGAY